jgi:hypothetical protein
MIGASALYAVDQHGQAHAMTLRHVLAAALLATSFGSLGCQQQPSKLDGMKSVEGGAASGDLESRVARLEATNAKYAEALNFLQQVYGQQKAQQQAQEDQEPAPDAIFAVDIQGDQVEGPKEGGLVTIVEAWDFA